MDKFNWENEIDTPSKKLVSWNRDKLIQKFPKEVKSTKTIEVLLKLWPQIIFFGVIGLAIYIPLFLTGTIVWDLIFVFAIFVGLFSAIAYVVALEVKKKKNKRIVDSLEVFKSMSESFKDIYFEDALYSSESLLVSALPRCYKVPESSMIIPEYSFKFVGKYNELHFEFLSTKWATPNGHVNSGSIIIKLKNKIEDKITIAVDKIKMENRLIVQDLENNEFNDTFNIYGDPVLARKIFNTTEQEKFIKLNKDAGEVQIDIVDDIAIIAFPLKSDYINAKNFVSTVQKTDWEKVLDKFIGDFEIFMSYFSYFSVLRYFK